MDKLNNVYSAVKNVLVSDSKSDDFVFNTKHSFEQRKIMAIHIINKYPDRLPVIVEKILGSDIQDIDKNKYLVPNDLTIGQFIFVIRKRINLREEQGIFLSINNTLPPISALFSQIYKEHVDPCGFLYIKYSSESTFG